MANINDIVQIVDDRHQWFAALVVVTKVRDFGIMGYMPIPHKSGAPGVGQAYVNITDDQFEKVGTVLLAHV